MLSEGSTLVTHIGYGSEKTNFLHTQKEILF